MYSTWLMPEASVRRARDAAREAGFDLNSLADYCRSSRRTGVVLGFGGVTDAQLDRALAAIARGLGS
jgi:GntR family transcriptional regulator/MocR family aminotransferase